MQQNEELFIKIDDYAHYIVKRFNKEFKGNPEGLILQIRRLTYRKGYNLYFNKKEFYYDVNLIAERIKKEQNLRLFLGTVDIYYLGDQATETDYYFLFLRVINKLFKTQSKKKKIYNFEFPKIINAITKELSNYDVNGFKQESLII